MNPIQTKLEGQEFYLFKLERILPSLGCNIGGNWDYEKGSYDYKITCAILRNMRPIR